MLVEFSLIPVGGDPHTSGVIAAALKIVSESGLPYQLNPAGTCIEGDWDEVMGVIRRCHEHVRQSAPHVVTTIKVEDEKGERDMLNRNVASVREKFGHGLEAETEAASGVSRSHPEPVSADD